MDWTARIRTARPAGAPGALAGVGPRELSAAGRYRVVQDRRVHAYPL